MTRLQAAATSAGDRLHAADEVAARAAVRARGTRADVRALCGVRLTTAQFGSGARSLPFNHTDESNNCRRCNALAEEMEA